jgi:hypothetical protein
LFPHLPYIGYVEKMGVRHKPSIIACLAGVAFATKNTRHATLSPAFDPSLDDGERKADCFKQTVPSQRSCLHESHGVVIPAVWILRRCVIVGASLKSLSAQPNVDVSSHRVIMRETSNVSTRTRKDTDASSALSFLLQLQGSRCSRMADVALTQSTGRWAKGALC